MARLFVLAGGQDVFQKTGVPLIRDFMRRNGPGMYANRVVREAHGHFLRRAQNNERERTPPKPTFKAGDVVRLRHNPDHPEVVIREVKLCRYYVDMGRTRLTEFGAGALELVRRGK